MRDALRGGNKEPLIDDEEWIKIKNFNANELETWDQRNEISTGRKRKHMELTLKLNKQGPLRLKALCPEERAQPWILIRAKRRN